LPEQRVSIELPQHRVHARQQRAQYPNCSRRIRSFRLCPWVEQHRQRDVDHARHPANRREPRRRLTGVEVENASGEVDELIDIEKVVINGTSYLLVTVTLLWKPE